MLVNKIAPDRDDRTAGDRKIREFPSGVAAVCYLTECGGEVWKVGFSTCNTLK
jgi:hypothetical protein